MNTARTALLLIILLVWTSVVSAFDDVFDQCFYCSESAVGLLPVTRYEKPIRQYGESKPFDIKHIKLELTIDFDTEKLNGIATTTLVAVGESRDEIVLNSIGLDIAQAVAGDGSELEFEVTEDKLNLFLPDAVEPGEEFSVSVTYSVEKPAEGLYFRTERMGYDPIETQAWTQGELEGARYWFPCFDYPNERATTEIIVTVPDEFAALSNGALLATREDKEAGTKTFHWLESVPHVSYLVSLVVGRFVAIHDSYRDIPVNYYVLPKYEKDAHLSFSKTPDMMRFFEEKIGVPYPYEKYVQVTVVDFIAGGMENTSITTLTERTLHDQAAHLTERSDGLVAHELAHQWFGDLVTCRDWANIWLNEGFASYLDPLYTEHDLGQDEFQCRMMQSLQRIVSADKGAERAPIVRRTYDDATGLFDFRSYQKGAWVLHMLRCQLGDDLFWKCVHEYCVRYRGKVVETTDLMRTIEDVTGRSMERFFDQWVYHGGHPELTVSYSWLNAEKLAKLVVKQTQTVDDTTPLFHFGTEVLFSCPGGDHIEKIEITEREHTFHIPLAERPEYVRFDPARSVLMDLEFKGPKRMLLAQLEKDMSAVGRIAAIEALEEFESSDVVDVLGETLRADPFWRVRSEAASALGELDNDKVLDVLLPGLEDDEARVRRSVVRALGKIDEEQSCEALIDVISDEKSPYVVASAIKALGKMKCRDARKPIRKALSRDSHGEVIRNAALDALVDLDEEDSLKTITAYCSPDKPRPCRRTAISAVGRLCRWMDDKDKPRETLVKLLDDPVRWVRVAAMQALGTLGDPKAVSELERVAETARNGDEKKAAERAVERIDAAREQTQEIGRLREQVEELQKAGEKLERRVKDVEGLLEAVEEQKEQEGEDTIGERDSAEENGEDEPDE